MDVMSSELSKDTLQLLQYVLPGFLAAWVFYGLTSHAKPSQFERVVQALILTFIVHALLTIVREVFLFAGKMISVGSWNYTAAAVWSVIIALTLGAALAHYANNDRFHNWLRARGFTTRTSHPSEWFSVLSRTVTFVVLHLDDGRRLYGWPKEWPIDPDGGQFYIIQPSWIDENGDAIELPQTDGVLVRSRDVHWVEFIAMTEGEPT